MSLKELADTLETCAEATRMHMGAIAEGLTVSIKKDVLTGMEISASKLEYALEGLRKKGSRPLHPKPGKDAVHKVPEGRNALP